MTLPVCGSCGAPVRWGVTTLGARIPVDPDPDPAEGTVWLTDGGRFRVLTGEETARARGHELAPERLFTAHWKSCPSAAQHRVNRDQLSLLAGA